jgi:hypothetical protein
MIARHGAEPSLLAVCRKTNHPAARGSGVGSEPGSLPRREPSTESIRQSHTLFNGCDTRSTTVRCCERVEAIAQQPDAANTLGLPAHSLATYLLRP